MPITIRTTLVALIVAVGLTVSMLALSSAAHATKNTGAFWQSSAASHLQYCDQLFDQFQYHVDQADQADKAGNRAALQESLKNATAFLHDAQHTGCDWA
jgi:hypothetical protein